MNIAQHTDLAVSLTKREIATRYVGSFVGAIWSFVNPLLLLAVYTLIFGLVFKAKWGGQEDTLTLDFALILFVGLIVFIFFSECVMRAPTLISSQPNFVKKIVFPLPILPVSIVLAAGFHALISLLAWLAMYVFVHGAPAITIIAAPLVLVPLLLGTLGVVFFLSSLGVFVRDISQVVTVLTQSLLFLSPVFYSVEQAPGILASILAVNPLSYVMEELREVLMFGRWPDLLSWLQHTVGSLVVAWLGYK